MSKKFQAVKGTRDLLPPDTEIWAAVEAVARRVFSTYGYAEIRTPILEDTDLFVRSVGESTDIVGKEMYTFEDRKGRSLTLRPENTASVVRAFVQHGLQKEMLPAKLYYMGPQFRYEKPQKGRYRQFYQIGAELIGDPGPWSDAELLLMLVHFLGELGFEDLLVQLNTVGDEASRLSFRDALCAYLEPFRSELSADSRRRLDTNPLRILDSKSSRDQQILADAPALFDSLSDVSRAHFDRVTETLSGHGVAFRVEPRLVRGLDYYTQTVFEIVSEGLGAQDAIVGGGRYDGLVGELGGPVLPAIGFAIGQDRLIEVLPTGFAERHRSVAPIAVVAGGGVGPEVALAVAAGLRAGGWRTVVELEPRSFGAGLKRAARSGSRWVVLIGDTEHAAGTVVVKDLDSGEQTSVAQDELSSYLERMS